MTPAGGIKAGEGWTLRFYVVNEGKKAIRISDMTATVTANGQRTGGPQVPRTREIAPQQRALAGEMGGSWQDSTTSWTAEVVVSAKGDTLKNTIAWR
jgi:putative intracellular protease/amidase